MNLAKILSAGSVILALAMPSDTYAGPFRRRSQEQSQQYSSQPQQNYPQQTQQQTKDNRYFKDPNMFRVPGLESIPSGNYTGDFLSGLFTPRPRPKIQEIERLPKEESKRQRVKF